MSRHDRHYVMSTSERGQELGTHLVNAASPLAHGDSSDPPASAIFER